MKKGRLYAPPLTKHIIDKKESSILLFSGGGRVNYRAEEEILKHGYC